MQINQYANTATSVTDADWLDLDKSDGMGGFESQKLSLPVLMDSMSTLDPNFGANIGNSDLQLTGNRLLDANGFTLGFSNLKTFVAEANVAPSGGASSFEFIGYGSTNSDLTHVLSTGAGDGFLMYGNLDKEFYGETYFDNEVGIGIAPSAGIGLFASNWTTGVYAIGTSQGVFAQSTNGYGGRFSSINNVGGYFESTNEHGGEFNASASGKYCGRFVAGGTASGIYCFAGASGYAVRSFGNLLFENLPTSSAGLPAGAVWNDSGTLKIV